MKKLLVNLILFGTIFLLIGFGNSFAAVPEYHGSLDSFVCPDTASFKSRLMDGDLESISKEIEKFAAEKLATHKPIPLPCWAGVLRYRVVLAYALKHDTDVAHLDMYMLVKIVPDVELFDLGISLSVQDLLDRTKEEYKVAPNSDEMFRRKLIPPPSLNLLPTERIEGMRQKYHDLRTLLAISSGATQFSDIMKSLKGETDPAFKLLNAQIMILIGIPSPKIRQVVNEAVKGRSEFMTEQNVSNWGNRLTTKITSLEKKGQMGTTAMKTTFGSIQ